MGSNPIASTNLKQHSSDVALQSNLHQSPLKLQGNSIGRYRGRILIPMIKLVGIAFLHDSD